MSTIREGVTFGILFNRFDEMCPLVNLDLIGGVWW